MSSANRAPGSPVQDARRGGADLPEKISRYQIKRLLGRGGQGAVYQAYDPNLAIDVAIKVLHPDYRSEEFIDRIKAEARTAVRLTAPNVVRVYDFDEQYPYLVMEYCGDGDLNRYLKTRKRRSLAEILGITRQVCEALVAAHENDPPILHRDLKPGNVLFQKQTPKVADFGLAKMLGGGTGLTTTRGVMGTVRYCSPEQLRDASKVDQRTDIWAAGVVLYELLTWARPFDKPGDSFVSVAVRVHTEPPRKPPYAIPAPVMAVILKAIEKDPERRYASAREMRDAIGEALRAVPNADTLLLPPEEVVDDRSLKAAQVATLLEQGRSQDADSIVREIRRSAPDDSLGTYWQHRLKEASDRTGPSTPAKGEGVAPGQPGWIAQRLGSIQSLIQNREYREARQRVGELLIQAPDSTAVQKLLEKITQDEARLRQNLDQAHADADRARAAGDYAALHAVWKKLSEAYPDLPEAQAELAVVTREMELLEQRKEREVAAALAGRLLAAGSLEEALAAWRAHTARFPSDQEALQASQQIEEAIAARERAERHARLAAEMRGRAAACLAAGDRRGALRAWESLLSEYQEDAEAEGAAGRLRQEIFDEERRAALAEVGRLASELRQRLGAGRYASLPDARKQAEEAVSAALTAASRDAAGIAAIRAGLAAARVAAEVALARQTGERRLGLEKKVEELRDWLPREPDGATRSASPGEQDLDRALASALAALCVAQQSGELGGDPLAPLASAEETLTAAGEALGRARQQALEETQSAARAALGEAQAALQALAATAGEDVGQAPVVQALEERLRKLQEKAGSQVPERLSEVARQAGVLRAETAAARVAVLWSLGREIGSLLDEGLTILLQTPDETLRDLLGRAARAIDPQEGRPPVAQEVLVDLRRDLRRELVRARSAREERLARARARWEAALQAWRDLLVSDLGSRIGEEGERVAASGQLTLAEARVEELDGWAAQLEDLARRYRLESAWIEQSNAVLEIEGPLGPDGLPVADLEPQLRKVLAGYRKAAALGDSERLRALDPQLEEQARSARGGGGRPVKVELEAAPLGPAARRFNQRFAPAALQAFDDLVQRYDASRSQRREGEAARLGAELNVAYRRLLRPPPVWRRPWVPAAASLVVAAALALPFLRPVADNASVTLVSPGGVVEVTSVTRGGEALPGLARPVSEESATLTDLEPGHYVITVRDGSRREFDVPGERVVLLPGGQGDSTRPLLRELGLAEIASRQ